MVTKRWIVNIRGHLSVIFSQQKKNAKGAVADAFVNT